MKLYNEKGAGLVLTIMVMAVLSILGTALLSISSSGAKLVAHQNKIKQAYYLARSGVDATAAYLINNPEDDALLLTKISEDNSSHFPNGKFKVQVDNGDPYQIRIIGTGNVAGVEKSAAAVIRRLTVGELLSKAIYTNSPLDITNMVVEGDIQSGGEIVYKTTGHNQFDTTKNSVLPNSIISIDTVPPKDIPLTYSPLDLVVSGEKVIIQDSYKFNSITIEQNKTFEIIANDKIVNIVVDAIIGKGNINIVAAGNGRVNLYVDTKMEVKTGGYINNDYPKNLYIYMQQGSTFELQAGIAVNAYIIAPDADAVIQSEKSIIYGALIANKLTKNGVNAPNGKIVFVSQENDSQVDESLKAYKLLRWEE